MGNVSVSDKMNKCQHAVEACVKDWRQALENTVQAAYGVIKDAGDGSPMLGLMITFMFTLTSVGALLILGGALWWLGFWLLMGGWMLVLLFCIVALALACVFGPMGLGLFAVHFYWTREDL